MRFALLLIALLACAGCGTPASAIELTHAEYRWRGTGEFHALTRLDLEPPDRDGAQMLEVCYQVPALDVSDPVLAQPGASSIAGASVDGKQANIAGGILPLGAPRQAHRACIVHRAWYPLGSHGAVVGSELQLVRWTEQRELPQFALGLVFAVLGIALLGSSLRTGAVRSYRFVGAFALSLSLVSVSQALLLRSLILESGWRWLTAAGLGAAPATAALFVRDTVGDTRKGWLRVAAVSTLAFAVLLIVLDAVRVVPVQQSYRFVYLFVLLTTVVIIPHLIAKARGGDRAAKALLYGLGALVLISLPDVAVGLDLTTQAATGFTSLGLLVFFLFIGYAVEQSYRTQRARLEQTAGTLRQQVTELEERGQEIETLNEELRHQLERRSRELQSALSGARNVGTSSAALTRGAVVDGRYRVERRLGAGAMGAVYDCVRLTDERHVAVKLMTGLLRLEQALRFAREAEIAAKLRHECLVPLVDVGVAPEGYLYLVMELVVGNTLEDERARFGDARWGLPILTDVARGLAALHEAKIVHRDLKPSNVLLDRRGTAAVRARIADFGIARPDESPAFADTALPDDPALARTELGALTQTGALVGTPLYMPPEAARGESSLASDVFALGVVMHEVLTGAYPFAAPPVFAARAGAEAAILVSPDLAPELSTLVAQMLDPNPAARPAAEAVRAALERAQPVEKLGISGPQP
ncbi:MAG: protein kinase [Myxococcales bacterium]|nr:protein kinase [Myxococcales bacterium]MCB9578627.1 protein kinase [Polyangiaceae bacterium]